MGNNNFNKDCYHSHSCEHWLVKMTEKANKVVIAISRVVKISVRITEVVGQVTVSDAQPRLCTALDAPPVYVYVCVCIHVCLMTTKNMYCA